MGAWGRGGMAVGARKGCSRGTGEGCGSSTNLKAGEAGAGAQAR